MSTNINITVGGDDLIRRAQAEQAAHRQSQQIDRSRDKAGEKGRVERNRRLANQGVDGSRSLVPTAPFTPPRQPEELTAHADENQQFIGTFWNFNSDFSTQVVLGAPNWSIGFIGDTSVFSPGPSYFGSVDKRYFNAGSGVPALAMETSPVASESAFAASSDRGETNLILAINGYETTSEQPGVTYYKNREFRAYQTRALGPLQSAISVDYAVLPTGKGNGILLYINRGLARQASYKLITQLTLNFDEFLGFSGYGYYEGGFTPGASENLHVWFGGEIVYLNSEGDVQTLSFASEAPQATIIGSISGIDDNISRTDKNAIINAEFPGAVYNNAVEREDAEGYFVYDGIDWASRASLDEGDPTFSLFEYKNGYQENFYAFAINKNTIRPIEFPEKLKELYLEKWPGNQREEIIATLEYQKFFGGLTATSSRTAMAVDINQVLTGNWESSLLNGGYNQSFLREALEVKLATPDIYSIINQDLGFTDPSNIKQYSPSRKYIAMEDRSVGLFSAYANSACTDDNEFRDFSASQTRPKNFYDTAESIDFATWKKRGETPDYSVFNTLGCPITENLPKVTKNKKSKTVMNPDRGPAPNPSEGDLADLIIIYDAEDPGYCRQMALEMGFQNSDFYPEIEPQP